MAGKEQRESQRVPVALRIKLRFRKVDSFVSKFATNISTRGMFISSRNPKEAGTQLRFELRLADDSTVIAGRGIVTWVRPFDPKRPKEPHGMGIEFVGLSNDSKALIDRMVSVRLEQGLGDEGIPFAVDDATDDKVVSAGDAVPSTSHPDAPEGSREDSRGAVETHQGAVSAPGRELSLTDVISSRIDMRAALERARELAGTGLADKELSELSRVSAAPAAESVDLASLELAQLLGGRAIVTRAPRELDPPTDHSGTADLLDEVLNQSVEDEEDAYAAGASDVELDDVELDDVELDDVEPDDVDTSVAVDALPMVEDVESEAEAAPPLQRPSGSHDEEEMEEEPAFDLLEGTAVGNDIEATAAEMLNVEEDPATPLFPLLENEPPRVRAQTEVQDIDSYDVLAAEREFAATADADSTMLSDIRNFVEMPNANGRRDDTLGDLLGELESETEDPETDVGTLDIIEESESTNTAVEPLAVDETKTARSANVSSDLDSALASLSDPSSDLDDDEFEIDITDNL